MTKAFIIASSSISAIGDQHECTNIDDQNTNLMKVKISSEQKEALYFPIKQNKLNKTFDEIIELLSEQISKAIIQSNLTEEELSKTVLFLGSTSLDISCVEPEVSQSIWLSQTDKISQTLTQLFGLHKVHYTVNTACTSSANALLYAAKMIKHHKIKHAIVIGCEFYNQLSVCGFDSLDLFSTTTVKPFSKQRDGLVLGEGVGVLVLSYQQSEFTVFEMLGGYSACDDFSLTVTDEEGEHISEVVGKALKNCNIKAKEIDLIKVHGTASEKSDLAEYNAIKHTFSDCTSKNQGKPYLKNELYSNAPVKLIGFKSFLGHTLGACGALEVAILENVCKKQILPKCEYQHNSPELLLYPFVQSVKGVISAKYILLNHFGFGGNNAALILKQVVPNTLIASNPGSSI